MYSFREADWELMHVKED